MNGVIFFCTLLLTITSTHCTSAFTLDTVVEHADFVSDRIFERVALSPKEEDFLREYTLIDDFDDDVENRTDCVRCKGVMTSLKALATAMSWEEAEPIVIDICYYLFENLTDEYVNTDELCPGIIGIQGPHVYEILQPKYRKSPEDICRNFNSCFPPRQGTGDQSETNQSQDETKSRAPKRKSTKTLQERKAEAITFVQMTDMHFEIDYAEGSDATDCGLAVCCQAMYGEGDAWLYGEYTCNIPIRTMELFFHKTVELNPTFVVYSGDTPPHTMWDETYNSQLNCTQVLIQKSEEILGDYKVYPNIGNHEMFPTNLFSKEYLQPYTQDMLDEFAAGWTELAGFSEEQQETMQEGGYYTLLLQPGLRLLSFNTNYWYVANFYNTLNEGREEVQNMKSFMRDTFEMARANDEKILLLGHHPPGQRESIILQTRDFEQLVANYSDVIALHIAGHTHNDHFKLHEDSSGMALATTLINPSVTTKTNHNPSMRLYYLDPETFQVIDYEQYGFNLREASGSSEPPVIDLVYSAMDYYELEDMSPASWQAFNERMKTDDELLRRYNFNFITRYDENATCDEACRTEMVCGNAYYSYDNTVYCMEEWEGPALIQDNTDDASESTVLYRLYTKLKSLFEKTIGHIRSSM